MSDLLPNDICAFSSHYLDSISNLGLLTIHIAGEYSTKEDESVL